METKTEEDTPLFLPMDDDFGTPAPAKDATRKSSPVSDVTMRDILAHSSPPRSSSPLDENLTCDLLKAGPSKFKAVQAHGSSQGAGENRKKRKVESNAVHSHIPIKRSEYYLGSIIVGNAWSTVRGTGYIKNGDPIFVERDTLMQQDNGKEQKKKGGSGKGKQVTINQMFKPQTKSELSKKPKANTVVRLTNARGFEFGRLPTDVSNWVSKLMDFGIISFKGSTMVDCPEKLHSGADLLVSLSFYMLPTAFKRYTPDPEHDELDRHMFNEGVETAEEEKLRNRKESLQQLFEKLGLTPRITASSSYDKENIPPKGSQQSPAPGSGNKQKRALADRNESSPQEEDVEDDVEALNEDDLDVIYKRAQAKDAEMEEMEPCSTFALKLRSYQKQALYWMYSRETGAASARQSESMNPLWSEFLFPPEPDPDGLIDLTAEEQPFYYNTHSGELSLEFPHSVLACRGGILADGIAITFGTFFRLLEMGMGKTIMLSSLIQTNRGEKPEEEISVHEDPELRGKQKQLKLDAAFRPIKRQNIRRSRATLIIAPASLLDQWASEISRSSVKGTVNVIVWHGQGREDLGSIIDMDIDAIDVVITSFGTLSSEHSRPTKPDGRPSSALFNIDWFRIVLDEAHNIKSRTSKAAKAAFDIRSSRRWALTGTPIVNRLEDLHSLLRFLNFAPWSDYTFFRTIVTLPFLNRDPKAIEVVQIILESSLLRREKTMRDRDGNRIVQLPSKEVKHDYLRFSPLERRVYDALYNRARKDFDELDARGTVGKNYTHILAMLMRLRRAVLHPSLVLVREEDNETPSSQNGHVDINKLIEQFTENEEAGSSGEAYAQTVLNDLSAKDEECPFCLDTMEDPVLSPLCAHKYCKDCILGYINDLQEKGEEGQCPVCRRGPMKESSLLEIVKRRKIKEASVGIEPEVKDEDGVMDMEAPPSSPAFELRRNDFKSSTKLNALVQNLRRLKDQDPCFRAIVFSQFTSFLDLIEVVMNRENLVWYRLDGSTDLKRRHQAISEFKKPSREPKVFLLSLKAGGVGLNLTAANHVFMMDCWWNAAIENQAIDRVHRIGQEKTVYVTHFIVSNTIEGRILKIQKRKTAIIKEALKGQTGADSESVENLRIMFGEQEED